MAQHRYPSNIRIGDSVRFGRARRFRVVQKIEADRDGYVITFPENVRSFVFARDLVEIEQ